ncbi:hypothetical protein PMAC_003171 [Pneumocystis sp. 'macacae']|nr:hypothetical protein PMAC_003171 [Pneumocystis sp. 'macacae']
MASSDSDVLSVSSYLSLDKDTEIPDPCCNGCNSTIEEGSVVAFGGHIWHVNCFRCAKCNRQVNHNSDVLLLFDGSPVCDKCSCNCKVCNKHIDGFAIMTGNETYHSECFQCDLCRRKIEDLVFAKTNQGIYCMSCHNNKIEQNKNFEKESHFPITFEALNKSLPSIPKSSISNKLNLQTSGTAPVVHNDVTGRPYIDFSPEMSQTELLNINQLFPEFEGNNTISKNNLENPSMWSSREPLDFFHDFPKTINSETEYLLKTKNIANNSAVSNTSNTITFSTEVSVLTSNPEDSLSLENYENSLNTKDILEVEKHAKNESVEEFLSGEFPSSKKFNNLVDFFKIKDSQNPDYIPPLKADIHNKSLTENNENRYSTLEGNSENRKLDSGKDIYSHDFSSKYTYPFHLNINTLAQKISNSSYIADNIPKENKFSNFKSYNKDCSSENLDIATLSKKNQEYNYYSRIPLVRSNSKLTSPPSTKLEISSSPIKDILSNRTNINPLDSKISDVSSKISSMEYSSLRPYKKDICSYNSDYIKNQAFERNNSNQSYSKILNVIRHKKSASESKKKALKNNTFLKHSRIHKSQLHPSYINLNKSNEIIDDTKRNDLQKTITNSYFLGESETKMTDDGSTLDKDILKKKTLLIELDAKREIALQELKILENEQLVSQDCILSNEIFIATIISKLSTSLRNLKNSFQSEIETLILQRNALYEENTQLQDLRNKIAQDIYHLDFKKLELKDLNDKLVQKIQNQFRTYKSSDSTSPIGANSLFRDENTKPLPPIVTPVSKSSNNDNFDSISYTESVSTPASEKVKLEYTESSDDNSLLKTSNKDENRLLDNKVSAWKKSTTLTKNLVRGFNKTRFSENDDMHNNYGNSNLLSNINNLTLNSSSSNNSLKHAFSTYTFLRITKCDYCGGKLWGNEMRCLGCGIPCHIKCIGDIVTSCNKNSEYLPYHEDTSYTSNSVNLYVPAVFGNDLIKQIQTENRDIPFIVTKCVDEVEKRGMFFEGIYRKSGSASQMRLLVDAFNRNDVKNLSQSKFEDISVITSVLKQYFRKLPNPLITYKAYKPFLEIAASNKTWVEKLELVKDVLSILPKAHYDCLEFLILHLFRVTKHSDKNLMSSKNLAVVFSPTLLRDESGMRDIIDIQAKNIGMQYLLDNAENIFGGSSKEKEHENNGFI